MDQRALLVVIQASFVLYPSSVCLLALPSFSFPFFCLLHQWSSQGRVSTVNPFLPTLPADSNWAENINSAWWQATSIACIVKARLTGIKSKCGWCHLALVLAVHCMFTSSWQVKRFFFSCTLCSTHWREWVRFDSYHNPAIMPTPQSKRFNYNIWTCSSSAVIPLQQAVRKEKNAFMLQSARI